MVLDFCFCYVCYGKATAVIRPTLEGLKKGMWLIDGVQQRVLRGGAEQGSFCEPVEVLELLQWLPRWAAHGAILKSASGRLFTGVSSGGGLWEEEIIEDGPRDEHIQ